MSATTKHPAKVIIAEDDETQGQQLLAFLSTYFLEVELVARGSNAVERVVSSPERYDVVIMDQVFQEQPDGLECLRKIRQAGAKTEVLLLTGYGDRETALQGLRAGAFRYMIKPPHPEELLANIEAAYDAANRRDAITRLSRENEEWKTSAMRVIVLAGIALASVLILTLVFGERSIAILVAFGSLILILGLVWHGLFKIKLGWRHRGTAATIDIRTLR